MADKTDKTDTDHALKMLSQYLTEGAAVYVVCVGHSDGTNGRSFKRVFTTVDENRIVNLNLYIANLVGIRRDGWGNVTDRASAQEIVGTVAYKLGRKLKVFNM